MATVITYEQAVSCCASTRFAQQLAAQGPYADLDALLATALRVWWTQTGVPGWLEALAAHPKIGDKKGMDGKPEAFAGFSRNEQSAAEQSLSSDVSSELVSWNQRYLDKFGFIFIIFAKGRSAPEILAALMKRYQRLPHEELQTAAQEQMKITELRLTALLSPPGDAADAIAARTQRRAEQVLTHLAPAQSGPLRSPITTHVLDTATGLPARGLPLALSKQDEVSRTWEVVGEGVTNEDGRVGSLMPPGHYIPPGRYRMFFDTATYLTSCKLAHPAFYSEVPFYPEVVVEFIITADKATEHYHIPLLLSPYGFSTYRGS
ncbi:Uric acid degradation bifunctional protein TTL [Tetrabaena socialis]|uniref:Uric acid degradation bifunctional protein TTL n=1 Tax=Tetrabaena socialis TaxID=47790 RepID=A0A2J8A7Y0_9CHLO|nr:Uric acid degradation bifunctional protein TTL [Tetrabaena socialis]|eukprot:PNH08636.1 Uric acid degradation bifunctional protein TTL [Tetrabaena socialis]